MDESGLEVPRKQHLISKSLLRRFAQPDGNLSARDLRYERRAALKHVSSVCWRLDFVAHLPNQAERLWETVESQLRGALTAIENDELTGRDEGVLKQTIALHFFRRDATKLAFEASLANSLDQRAGRFAVAIPQGVDPGTVEDRLRKQAAESAAEWFQERIESLFKRATELVSTAGLELLTAVEGEFLIGDQAVLSLTADGGFGKLPFTTAATHLLPVGRHHAIALASTSGRVLLNQEWVNHLNRAQMEESASHVFYHPASGLDDFVASVRAQELR